METRLLRYFACVVDNDTISNAAAELNITQPSVSQAIRTLERESGVILFHRVGRKLILTDAGQVLLRHARHILSDIETAQKALTALTELSSGTLSIAATALESLFPLAVVLGRFHRRYPGIRISFETAQTPPDAQNRVMSGRSELGLIPIVRNDKKREPALTYHYLMDGEMYVAVPPEYCDLGQSCTLESVAHLPFIARPKGTYSRTLLDAAIVDGIPINILVDSPHDVAIPTMIAKGLGACLLPKQLALETQRAGACIAQLEPTISYDIVVVHRTAPLSPSALAFLELIDDEHGRHQSE